MKTLRYSTYPTNGFGPKNGQPYIIDEWGNIYDFQQEHDAALDEYFWTIDLPVIGHDYGASPRAIIDRINQNYNAEDMPAELRTLQILPWDGKAE